MRNRIVRIILCLLLTAAMICASSCKKTGSGSSSSDDRPVTDAERLKLTQAVKTAEPLLYGSNSVQSRKYAFDRYDRAAALLDTADASNHAVTTAVNELEAAVAALAPMAGSERVELGGFAGLTDAHLAAMSAGAVIDTAVKPDGVQASLMLTAADDGSLRYSNAAAGGISGASPFGKDMSECDGLFLWVQTDAPAYMTVSVASSSAPDAVSLAKNIYVSDGYVLIPFERFSGASGFPLDGSADIIELVFTAAGDAPLTTARFADLYAFREKIETAAGFSYSERALSSMSLSSGKFYRITNAAGSALSFGPRYSESETKWDDRYLTTLESKMRPLAAAPARGDYTQQWAVIPYNGKYLIVNRDCGAVLELSQYGGSQQHYLTGAEINLNNGLQLMDIAYTPSGFTIGIDSIGFIGFYNNSFSVTEQPTSYSYFTITEISDAAPWELNWSDEFDGDKLDRSVWTPDNAKNRPDKEPVYYRDREGTNFYIEDGKLVIKSIREQYEGIPVTSAQISTAGKMSFSFGRVEMKAKLATGNHIWPAFWMLGNDYGRATLYGEIDIMELVGGTDHKTPGYADSRAFGTVHWPRTDEAGSMISKGSTICDYNYESLGNDYHIYAIEWDENQIRWYFDDILYFVLSIQNDKSRWTFSNNTHWLILNTSVRGPGGDIIYDDTPAESLYYIDYVRYYTRASQGEAEKPLSEQKQYPLATYDLGARCISVAADSLGQSFYFPQMSGRLSHVSQKAGTIENSTSMVDESFVGGAVSPDNAYYACGTIQEKIYIYSTADLHGNPVEITNAGTLNDCMAFTADSLTLLATGRGAWDSSEGCRYIRGFAADTGRKVFEYNLGSFARCISVSDSGSFAVGCCDGSVFVFSADFKLITKFSCGSQVRALALSPDGGTLVTGCDSGAAEIHSAVNGKLIRTLAKGSAAVMSADFSPDGSKFLLASNDSTGRLYTASGKLITTLGGAEHYLRCGAFSPDGSKCAVASQDGTIQVFTADGAYLETLTVPASGFREIRSFAFSADSSRICASVSTQYGSSAVLWNLGY